MLEAGAHLGAYTIVRPLGAGGMGVVYLARHRHIGRDAAIKILLPELTKNEDIVARFLTEARATAAIRHPGIVEILDCDIDPTGRAYIVMEYLRGESLASCLARARRSLSALASVVSVGVQVASALAAAHERGIVHRDLKPDNLFLSTDGSPRTAVAIKILDFGIAKLVSGNSEGDMHKTRTGSMLGTPAYMSPEQARDASSIDDRADIYALGCILFEMIAGRPPFVRAGAGEVMIAHVIEAPPTLSSLVPDVDPALQALVAQMLEKDPAARPQTMTEVQARLEALVAGRAAPLMTAIMPTVDTSQPIVVPTSGPSAGASATPAPHGSHSHPGVNSRLSGVPLELPRELSSPSGRMIPGGTLLLPATSATATHSTTMSDSASEVAHRVVKTVSTRKRPAVAATIAGIGLVVVIAAFALRQGPPPTTPANPSTTAAAVGTPSTPMPTPRSNPTPAAEPVPPTPPAEPAPGEAPPAPKQVIIELTSDPSDAEVWLPDDKEPRGHTPFKVSIDPKAAPTRVILKARGYADKTLDLNPKQPDPIAVTLEKAARDHGKRKGSEGKSNGYRMMGD
jgi:serine/threonine protein kinase